MKLFHLNHSSIQRCCAKLDEVILAKSHQHDVPLLSCPAFQSLAQQSESSSPLTTAQVYISDPPSPEF
jgi:hypothetical protein